MALAARSAAADSIGSSVSLETDSSVSMAAARDWTERTAKDSSAEARRAARWVWMVGEQAKARRSAGESFSCAARAERL